MPTTSTEGPWPGPRPYDLVDGKVFRGRKKEIEAIRRRILTERLTILSGPSGVGKTSLLRAGVMWTLRASREKSQQEGRTRVPPILLLRDWGVGRKTTAEELFRSKTAEAIRFLEEWSPNDHAILAPALSRLEMQQGASYFDDIVGMCDLTDSLILVLDQFEEVLRAGAGFADEAITILQNIYRFERRARVLISLREEYHQQLHNLESVVEGLYERTIFLEPMITKTVREAIAESAGAASVQIADSVVKRVILWLQTSAGSERQNRADRVDAGQESQAGEPVVDLLTLQAILRELFEFCSNGSNVDGVVTIDEKALSNYLWQGSLQPEQINFADETIREQEEQRLQEVVGEALERWIGRSLNKSQIPTDGPLPKIYERTQQELTGYVHRIAARMAPLLSSGTYKTAADELDLMFGALQKDLQHLRPGAERIPRDAWRISEVGGSPRFAREILWSEKEIEDGKRNLSGVAIEEGWGPQETADQLAATYRETQRRLQAGNILKSLDTRWELVHDKLGQPFTRLAGKHNQTWEDAVYSLTVTRGSDILIAERDKRSNVVRHMIWQGCWIIQDDTLPSMDDVVFEDCNLQGSVFWTCTLRGVVFKNCDMDGALFLSCHFDRGENGQPVIFDTCRGNGLAIMAALVPGARSVVRALEMNHCNFSQLKFARLEMDGVLSIGPGTRLYLCDFDSLEPGSNNSSGRVHCLDGSKLVFCAWDKASKQVLEIDGDQYSSGQRPREE